MATDPRDFLLNTDYEMDKIVYFTSGSLTTNDSGRNINHGLGFIPLVFGICAFNSDFSDSRTIPFEYQTPNDGIFFNVMADSTKIRIEYVNYNDASRSMYYRIYAFEPSNSHATVSPTGGHANKFILNTDYNYCKLCKKGILNGDGSVSHGLGYIPQVLAWQEDSGVITPIDFSAPEDPITNYPYYAKVTTSSVSFKNMGKVHYRIYYDEV